MTRRGLLRGTLVAATAASLPGSAAAAAPKDIVIASSNGLACCARAMELLQEGEDTLDAVIAGVNIQELDPEDTSVGYGGLPNEDGVVELDSCVMHGPSRRAGAVGALQGIKTPSKIAQLVMERTDHVMMVADGALRFAQAHGFEPEDLLTEKSRFAWLTWKESLKTDWGPGLDAPGDPDAPGKSDGQARFLERFPGAKPAWLAWARRVVQDPPTGTINCLALNRKGEISGCTTTSGLAWNIPGRVGDSPIIGAGLYVDQDVGAAGSTGRGEENIRIAGAHTVVENMRHGMSPEQACLDALKRVARNYDHIKDRLPSVRLRFYALSKDGQFGAASLWSGERREGRVGHQRYAVNDGGESRLIDAAYLYERK